jgi:hypothetical protein
MPGNVNGPRNPPEGTLRLALPVTSPELPVPVVELFLKK